MKTNLINTMKGATLGLALLGLGASQVRADEFTISNPSSTIFKVRYSNENEDFGFSLNNQYFDCKNLDHYDINQRVEIEQVCQGLPYLIQREKSRKIDEQLSTKISNKKLRNSLGFNLNESQNNWDKVGIIK